MPITSERQKKQLHQHMTGMECRGDAKMWVRHPQEAAEVLEGYFSGRGFPLRSIGSKSQNGLPSLKHQSSQSTQTASSSKKWEAFSLPGTYSFFIYSVNCSFSLCLALNCCSYYCSSLYPHSIIFLSVSHLVFISTFL